MLRNNLKSHLNHGDLIGHKAIAYDEITFGDVQALFCYGGGYEQIDLAVTKLVQHVLLLCLEMAGQYFIQMEIIPLMQPGTLI